MLGSGDQRDEEAYRDFKRETVRIALTSDLPRERVAADMGIGKSTLHKWIAQYRPSDVVIEPQADLARENERLRLGNRILKEERDILKNGRGFGPPVRGRNGLCYGGNRRVAADSLLVV
ncbi:transposase [Novosphingobium sp. SG751A]|uniref:transposase n=1 Tax=Novosphingobium sp. SG751A TaxID=2587000 RepID=UPI001C12C296|nr:transposase [Novosphingobium sp. SG751A]